MDHHIPPGYSQDNYNIYNSDPSIGGFPGNNDYMYNTGGRPMSPPPGDEDVASGHEHLPSALEEVLAYKEIRVREVGHTDSDSKPLGKYSHLYIICM